MGNPDKLDLKLRVSPIEAAKTEKNKSRAEVKADLQTELTAIKADIEAATTQEDKVKKIEAILNRFFVDEKERYDTTDDTFKIYYDSDITDGTDNIWEINQDFEKGLPTSLDLLLTDVLTVINEVLDTDLEEASVKGKILNELTGDVNTLATEVLKDLQQYTGVYDEIRSKLTAKDNVATLDGYTQEVVGMKQRLENDFGITVGTSVPNTTTLPPITVGTVVVPMTEEQVRAIYTKYMLLEKELKTRNEVAVLFDGGPKFSGTPVEDREYDLETLRNYGYQELVAERQRIVTDPAYKHVGILTGKREKVVKSMDTVTLDKRQEINTKLKELAGYPGTNLTTLRTIGLDDKMRADIEKNGFSEVKIATKKGAEQVKTIDDLENCECNVTPEFKQQVSACYKEGKFMPLTGLNPDQIKYCTAYHELYLNHMTGTKNESEADFLTAFGKLDRKNGNETIGSVSDFRAWGREVKREYGNRNNKAKIVAKSIPCMVAAFQARAFSTWGLDYYDHLIQNGAEAAHHHGAPKSFDTCPDIWTSPPYYLADVCCERFGPNRQDVVGKHMPRGYFANKYPHLSTFVPPHMLYPTMLPGSSVHQRPARGENAIILRSENGGYEVKGDLKNDALLALYLHQYETTNITPGELDPSKLTDPEIAYSLMERWFTPGSYGLDVIGSLHTRFVANGMSSADAEHKAKEIGQQIIKDALKYDDDFIFRIREDFHLQTAYYRNAREQASGKQEVRDVGKIPEDQKQLMLSRAAVRGFAGGYRLGADSFPIIEDRLMGVYGGSRTGPSVFVSQSNPYVGENIQRLIDNQKGPGYALSPRGWSDYNSIDNVLDQIQSHGIIDTAGHAITAGLQQFPRMRPEDAQRLGSGLATVGKIAAVALIIKGAWDFFSGGDGFWGKAWRGGLLVGGAMLIGSDVSALLFGGKGGMLTRAAHHFLNNEKRFERKSMSPQQMLSFTFGNLTLQELLGDASGKGGLMEIDPATGQFTVKNTELQKMLDLPGMSEEQKTTLRAMFSGSSAGIGQMVNDGLTSTGITNLNYKEKIQQYGNMKLKDIINQQALATQNEALITGVLGVDDNDPLYTEITEALRNNTDPEQTRNAIERAQELSDYMGVYREAQVHIEHLLKGRNALFATCFGTDAATMQDAFEKGFGADTKQLRKQMILGELPFDATKTPADNIAIFKAELKKLFADHAVYDKYLNDASGLATLESEVDLTTAPTGAVPDGMLTMDAMTNKTRYLNRTTGAAVDKYKEAMLNVEGKKMMMGIDESSTDPVAPSGPAKKYLVFWVPNSHGVWEQWKVTKNGIYDMYVQGAGWGRMSGGSTDSFLLETYAASSGMYGQTDIFSPKLLSQLSDHAQRGQQRVSLDAQAMNTASSSEPNPAPKTLTIERVPAGDRPGSSALSTIPPVI